MAKQQPTTTVKDAASDPAPLATGGKFGLTESAAARITAMLTDEPDGSFFRVAVLGGGCSGFQYEFTFDKEKAEDDLNYENILIDKTSADLLKGSEVDYVSELIGEQFKITNPQTKSSCGCGVSFSL